MVAVLQVELQVLSSQQVEAPRLARPGYRLLQSRNPRYSTGDKGRVVALDPEHKVD